MSDAALPAAKATSGPRRDAIELAFELFRSLRLSLALLLLLVGATVAGLLLQKPTVPIAELQKTWGAGFGWKLFVALELQDPLRSWWFVLLLVGLLLSVTANAIARLLEAYRLLSSPVKRVTEPMLASTKQYLRIHPLAAVPQEVARISAAFESAGFTPSVEKDTGGATFLFAERGRPAIFGLFALHGALLLLLVGAIVGRLVGEHGFVDVIEGGGRFNFVFVKASDGQPYRRMLDFTVRVDGSRLEQAADGSAGSFESDLAILDKDGNELMRQTISRHHPLRHDGWAFDLTGFEKAPEQVRARITVTLRASGVKRTLRVVGGEEFGFGDGVKFTLSDYAPTNGERGPGVQLKRTEGSDVTDFWLFKNTPQLDAGDRPDRYALAFEGLEDSYVSSIEAVRDPGLPLVWVGGALLLIGLALTLGGSHRRLWARIDGEEVLVAGMTQRRARQFEQLFDALAVTVKGGKTRA